jgi:hypothetical protein
MENAIITRFLPYSVQYLNDIIDAATDFRSAHSRSFDMAAILRVVMTLP